ncbi:MAG: preprotein translocase subunit SecG [Clostridia bacterium]|nr:preprotein translocase subunit SecG [Clostridia bacterium]
MLNAILADSWSDSQYFVYIGFTLAFIILLFLAAIATIILVLFQKSNSDGIQGITGSSETFFGKNKGRSIESKLKKWTWILLIVMALLSIAIYIMQVIAP